jgi:putative oxidoreductase
MISPVLGMETAIKAQMLGRNSLTRPRPLRCIFLRVKLRPRNRQPERILGVRDIWRSVVLNIFAALASRILLIALFLPFSALDKILNFKQAVNQAALSVSNLSTAALFIVGGFIVEVAMSLAVVTGFADRLAALILAGYCVVTALLWKQFWKHPDFKLRGASDGREIFWDFLKNLCVAGGFLLLAFGTDGSGIMSLIDDPLGSSHPYTFHEGIQ